MDLSFRVSWLCLVLWGCICFPLQTGYNIAHGYNLHKTSHIFSQVIPGETLKPTYEDEINAVGEQSFVSLQSEPIFYKDGLHGSSASFPEEMVQSQPSLGYKEDTEGENRQEVWRRQGKNDQVLDKHCFFTKPVDFTENVIPSTLHGNRVFVHQPGHQPFNSFVAPQLLSSELPNDGLPGGHKPLLFSVSNNNHIQPGYGQSQQRQIPLSKLSGDAFINHRTVAAFVASDRPSQDSLFFSKRRSSSSPLRRRSKVPRTKYLPVFSSDADNNVGFHKAGRSHVRSLPNPTSLNYIIPKNQIYVPNYEGKNKKKSSKSFRAYKSSVSKNSNDEDSYSSICLKNASPESTSNSLFSHLGLEANRPQSKQHGSFLEFKAKPSSTLHNPTGLSNNLEHQRLNSGPFTLAAHPEYKEKSARYKPSEDVFTQHEAIQKVIPPLSSFSAQDRFLFLNGGYEEAKKAGLIKPILQTDGLQILSDTMKAEPTNFASWPSELLSELKDKDLNCIVWKNTKSSSHPTPQESSHSSKNAYIKSKNRSTRATTFLSRTCYKPFQQMRLMNRNGNLP